MPTYQTFPILSSALFLHGDPTYQRPNIKYEYGAGPEEVRLTTSTGRYKEIPVTIQVNNSGPNSDFDKLIDFLGVDVDGTKPGRGLESEPFWYSHPDLGANGLVRYASSELTWKVIVRGQAGQPNWYRFDLILRGQWNA